MLSQAGFTELPGKGSHTNWLHPFYSREITFSGKDAADAKRYQEKEVKQAIEEVEGKKEDE
ncbi:MAG: type II toxin-antitoxin system HicA family toxin [Nostoc sp.]|uniref:type II toxin-antitoxin system HicA family toxin n=1 Tax=Nostoc sp. TaxID=1180 RepID=UPI002FF929B6